MINDPKKIMNIIIEEFEKQIIANGHKKGLSEEEIKLDLANNYKKLPRIAASATRRIING